MASFSNLSKTYAKDKLSKCATMSHPILRIKLNALNSCVPRDQSHTQVDKLQKYHHGVSYIANDNIT